MDSPGGVDGATGEEGATGSAVGGWEAARGDWVTVEGARRRSGRSPSLPSQQTRHIQVQVMPAPSSRLSGRGRGEEVKN